MGVYRLYSDCAIILCRARIRILQRPLSSRQDGRKVLSVDVHLTTSDLLGWMLTTTGGLLLHYSVSDPIGYTI